MVPYNLASVFLVCGSWKRCFFLDQLKRGGSRSAPQLLSVESPLLSVGRRPPPGGRELRI